MRNIFRSTPPLILLCFVIVALVLLCAVFAGPLSLYPLDEVNLLNRFKPPVFLGGSWANPLGTDSLGHDLYSMVLRGIQVSILVATIGTVGGAIIGTALGVLAGWFEGWVDNVISILVDFQATIPNLILALALITALPSADFTLFLIVMIIYGWERYARLARAICLSAKGQAYVQAQQVLGASTFRIVIRTILPNFMAVLLVNMSVNFPGTILLETTLSFLGIGIQPPDTSLGVLIGQGREQIFRAPWIILVPGTIILLVTVSISLIGDWARDLIEQD